MQHHIIFYFSGTGNSLKTALTIARKLEGADAAVRVVCVGPEDFSFDDSSPYDSIGFIYPCHFGGVPLRMQAFVEALQLQGQEHAYCYAVATYGVMRGVAVSQLGALLSKKGFSLSYAATVKAFSNYVRFHNMSPLLSEKTLALKEELEPVVACILAKEHAPLKKMNMFLRFYNHMATQGLEHSDKHFRLSSSCNACGQCQELCPVQNIKMELSESAKGMQPLWQHHCTQCLACLHLCPQKAIDYGRKTKGRGRYKHPEITLSMLIAYNRNEPEDLKQRY